MRDPSAAARGGRGATERGRGRREPAGRSDRPPVRVGPEWDRRSDDRDSRSDREPRGERREERRVPDRDERDREPEKPDWTQTDWDSFIVEAPVPGAAAAAEQAPTQRASAGDEASVIRGAFRDYEGKVRAGGLMEDLMLGL